MGIKIECKGKEILDLKNITFEFFYQKMLEAIHKKNITLSINLKNLIDNLELGGYGIGLDLSEYLDKKNDVETFGIIIQSATESLMHEFDTLPQNTKNDLLRFHEEIIKYAHTLS